MEPPPFKKYHEMREIFLGMWPTTSPSFTTATACLSKQLFSSAWSDNLASRFSYICDDPAQHWLSDEELEKNEVVVEDDGDDEDW